MATTLKCKNNIKHNSPARRQNAESGKKSTEPDKANRRDSKQSSIVVLLQRPEGATIDEMGKATGWQRHSVQGMMSGVLKKRLGLTITSEIEAHGRVYCITGSVSRL